MRDAASAEFNRYHLSPPLCLCGRRQVCFSSPGKGKREGKLLRVCKSFNHFFPSRLSVLTSRRKGRSPLPSRMQQQEQRKNKKEEEIKKRTAFSLTNLKPLLAPSTHISSPLPFLRDLLNFSLLRRRSTPFLLKRLDLEVRGKKGGRRPQKEFCPEKRRIVKRTAATFGGGAATKEISMGDESFL